MIDYPLVSIVILNWNGLKYLKQFLPSVCATVYPNFNIIVGDNASTDGSVQFLKDNYPQIQIIINESNFGFAGGYNRVLEQIKSDYFVLLNSDVEVDSNWIEPVIRLMEDDQKTAAAQPKIRAFNRKDHFEYAGAAGGFIDAFGYPFCRGRLFDTLEEDKNQYDQASEIFWASGAAFFVKRERWLEAGGLDEDFFAHMEEIDLCWRLKNLGYKIMYCPQSIVYHVGGGTLEAENPFKTYLNFRNNLVLLQKNLTFFKGSLAIFIRFWLDILPIINYLVEGKPKNARAISRAHLYFFINIFKNARKSKAINKTRFNDAGLFKGSIVWKYFAEKKKYYSQL
jgi:GT2 family glycosyltransferase